jgi:outer membrane receptor for ferrienterochelin and colicins
MYSFKAKKTTFLKVFQLLGLLVIIFTTESIAEEGDGKKKSKVKQEHNQEILSEMVVTGTRTERRLAEVPVRTEVVSEKLLKNSKARTLADAVEFTTGVRVESNCQNCNFSQIRLNGLDGAFTQILYDSQQTVSSLAAVYGIEQIPSGLIKQIEIVKGGASSLYGPGAIGGVVNIIPREPDSNQIQTEYRYEWMEGKNASGSTNNFNSIAEYASPEKDFNAVLFAQREEMAPLDLSGDEFTEIAKRELDAFGVRINRYINDLEGKVTLDYNRAIEDRRGGDNINLPPFQAEIAEDIDSTRDALLVSWEQTVSPKLDYRITNSFAYTDRLSYYGAGRNPNAFGETKNPHYNFDSQINNYFELVGSHTLSWGLQYNRSDIEDIQPAYNREIDDAFSYTGVYIQDDWSPFDKVNFISGIRVDKHSEINKIIPSPRLAVLYEPTSDFRLRSSVATGFRAPQVFDEDLHLSIVGGEATIIRNSANLKEERSISYQLGGEYTPVVGNGMALIETNLFYTDINDSFFNDVTDNIETDNQLEFTRINRGSSAVYGVEFNIGYQLFNNLSASIGYTEQRARFDDFDNDFRTRDYFKTPNRYGVATLNWELPELFEVFAGLKYTGPMKARHFAGFIEEDRLETTKSFLTFDLGLQKEILLGKKDKLVLSVGGRNLTNDIQRDFDNGPLRDSDYTYGPRFPRSIYSALKYVF